MPNCWSISESRALGRYRENAAHVRQSRPDSGLGLEVKVSKTFQVVLISVGSCSGACLVELRGVGDAKLLEHRRVHVPHHPRHLSCIGTFR